MRKRNLTEETETSEDDFGAGRGASDQEASSPKNINRRKTQHTKILSDDKIVRPSSSAMAAHIMRKQIGGATIVNKQINKSPLTQNQLSQSKFQGATKTYSILPQSRMIGQNKPAILRQPPRILNSTLCKPTNKATVPSLVTKVVTKDDYEHELNKKRNNNIISSRSKENNVTSYVYTEKDGKMIPKKTVVQLSQQQKFIQQRKAVLPVVRTQSTQQRIISEPVTMNIPNSRRIRKITCYETWYVIKMAEEQPKLEKSVLNLSLMQIGNEIKKIELPSSEWTYKILLQPLNKQLLEMRKTKANEKVEESKSKTTDESNAADEKTEETDSDEKTDSNQSDIKADVREKSKDITKEVCIAVVFLVNLNGIHNKFVLVLISNSRTQVQIQPKRPQTRKKQRKVMPMKRKMKKKLNPMRNLKLKPKRRNLTRILKQRVKMKLRQQQLRITLRSSQASPAPRSKRRRSLMKMRKKKLTTNQLLRLNQVLRTMCTVVRCTIQT